MKKLITLFILSLLFAADTTFACTIVSCARKGQVFAAANEDDYSSTPYARIWFNPPTKGRYGTVCFGLTDGQAQAMMNEYGLYVDYTAQYSIDPSKYHPAHPYEGDLFFEILTKCKTVNEALAFMKTHDYAFGSQALLADATGSSVVINIGDKVLKQGSFQINTNFNISDLKKGVSDRRYDLAKKMLIKSSTVSLASMKAILDRTHQEGDLTTLYSYVFDMKRGLIYVYFFHNFDDVYVIDIKKELKKGYRLDNLADHFPVSYAYETVIQKDPNYKKEQILSAYYKGSRADSLIDRYLAQSAHPVTGKDSTHRNMMIDIGIQLIKDAWNQHDGGHMWDYWFSLPGGYAISHFKDKRLDAAERIFKSVTGDPKTDIKMKNFLTELEAYISLIQGDAATAKALYASALSDQNANYPVSYNRAKKMLTEIN
ncbi:carcinine hydrolase/isopenicillin-N N-acyltransferase family protein [Mucilaginibacter sp.]|uniref:carcinine hydrolase/isopenicillin-N N-acyltransferase family protein n=1 Tax=Mucilaginibacter sp. TaxID=1882438 RepID=UPI0028480393|nr:carcinine hydrolase/isopenicillin-N N-acyltransferase family protein [Mucilaginibacter sp.]MDR3695119.1 carcinine hydrolase/isopenicillin-N N-acyltransferase family protein [Mucilaginibacter sp.]